MCVINSLSFCPTSAAILLFVFCGVVQGLYIGFSCFLRLLTVVSAAISCPGSPFDPFVRSEVPGTNDCCIQTCVCSYWPRCCTTEWDFACVGIAQDFCGAPICTYTGRSLPRLLLHKINRSNNVYQLIKISALLRANK